MMSHAEELENFKKDMEEVRRRVSFSHFFYFFFA